MVLFDWITPFLQSSQEGKNNNKYYLYHLLLYNNIYYLFYNYLNIPYCFQNNIYFYFYNYLSIHNHKNNWDILLNKVYYLYLYKESLMGMMKNMFHPFHSLMDFHLMFYKHHILFYIFYLFDYKINIFHLIR